MQVPHTLLLHPSAVKAACRTAVNNYWPSCWRIGGPFNITNPKASQVLVKKAINEAMEDPACQALGETKVKGRMVA